MVLATAKADAKQSGRPGGSWLPLPLAGFCCIALLLHGASASGEGIRCVLRTRSSHLWPKFRNTSFCSLGPGLLHHPPEDFITFYNKFSWINWYDRKKEEGNPRAVNLASVLRKIMEQFLMKTLHWHMRNMNSKGLFQSNFFPHLWLLCLFYKCKVTLTSAAFSSVYEKKKE